MSQGIESKAGPGNVVDDYDAICRAVNIGQEGDAKGDIAKLKEAFDADARLYGLYGPGGRRSSVSVAEYIEHRTSAPADTGSHRWRILSVQQTGNAALAVVAEDGHEGWVVTERTGGERPGGAQ
jgi:hypothetical protein